MRRIWEIFRGWPVWGQIVAGLLVIAVLGAAFGSSEEAGDSDDLSPVEAQVEDEEADDSGGDEAAPEDLECLAFPRRTADELISNSDTGERKIEGDILATAAVQSPETVSGNELWFISINVDGTVVTLGHDVPPGEGVNGSGLYYSMNPTSEAATSFPSDPRGEVTEATNGYLQAIECVEN